MASNPPPPPKLKEGEQQSRSLREFFESLVGKKNEVPRVKVTTGQRINNVISNNWRGLVGTIVPLLVLSWQSEKGNNKKTVELMWMWMFWSVLIQPVNVPVTGLIPVFLLPMTGVLSTLVSCGCYMTENTVLFILSAMVILLLNNSGIDRRLILWFLCSGTNCNNCQFSASRMILKSNAAAFFLSMFCNRLIVTSTIMQYLTPIFTNLKTNAAKNVDKNKDNKKEPNYDEMRYIILNSVQVASAIGSTAVMHSATSTILFRGIWDESTAKGKEYPDIFNYLQYSAFAFPVAFVMFILNAWYYMCLITLRSSKPYGPEDRDLILTSLLRSKAEIPKYLSSHEKLSAIFTIMCMFTFFFRWNQWVNSWSHFDPEFPNRPVVKDATVAAIFVVLLHSLPKGFGFLKYLDVEKKSDLPPLKAESGILWWKFVDKNLNYGYFFTFGSFIALMVAAQRTGLNVEIAEHFGKSLTDHSWNSSIFLVCFLGALLANVITSVAACGIFLPFVICMAHDAPVPWPSKVYLGALAVGISSSFGFCTPFMYTPAYYCHLIGKVPIKTMMKYSFLSVWICTIILWIALLVWAPFLFDPEDLGIFPQDSPPEPGVTTTTTGAPTEK